MNKNKLTLKQKRFADEYIIGGNATKAYLKAYKTVKNEDTARVNASRMLTNANIKNYIESKLKELDNEKIAEQEEVLERLTKFGRRQEFESVVVMTDKAKFDDNGNFLGIEKKPEIVKIPTPSKDTIKALELLGKRYGLFTEKLEIETEQVVIVDDIS